MTKAELYGFLAAHTLGVLGSISADGAPQSALVGIAVTEDLEIVFDTLDSTRKYRNLTLNPKASLVVGWEGEKTVQLEGEASLPVGEETDALQEGLLLRVAGWGESSELAGAGLLCRSSAMDSI